MPDQPEKLFDLMDIETEPTDEQLERLMVYVGEEVRKKKALAQRPLTTEQVREVTVRLVERLTNGA